MFNRKVAVASRVAPLMNAYITFSSDSDFTLTNTANKKTWDGIIKYSHDAITWIEWSGETVLTSSNKVLYIVGIGNTKITGYGDWKEKWKLTGTNIKCLGNIETLLDWETVKEGSHPPMGDYAFFCLFYNNANLITAPSLEATTLSKGCYAALFYNCSSISEAPLLPSENLAESCYDSMFLGCTALTTVSNLNATIVPVRAYFDMFMGCKSLVRAPEILATTLLSDGSMSGDNMDSMFNGCTNLVYPPSKLLPVTLTYQCYADMFNACENLVATPEFHPETLAGLCCFSMFKKCSSLTTFSALPATLMQAQCYYNLFSQCTALKFSKTRTAACPNECRFPSIGEGVPISRWNSGMFSGTSGTFTDDPIINTTYYTNATVI